MVIFLNHSSFSWDMAKDNKINMPSSGAGLTRYFDDEKSNIMISPQATVILILVVVAVILVLTSF
jgi:preprotein translocase subunit Sec61beta